MIRIAKVNGNFSKAEAILHYYGDQCVNKNLRLYTPVKELEAQYQRQLEQAGKTADGG